MRILLFHGAIDPLNHFTDKAKEFLEKAGCETFLCTLPVTKQNETDLLDFFRRGIHAVILYDGIGMYMKDIYDELKIPVVNILVDHPMTFGHCMKEPPRRYIQFSPDENHVAFSRKYWKLENSFFLPHMGTAPVAVGGERPTDLLFSGSCWSLDALANHIRQSDKGGILGNIFFEMIDYMLLDPDFTIEEACGIVLKDRNISLSPEELALILTQAKAVDEYVRMYYRGRAVRAILDYGMDITVIGTDWDRSGLTDYPNFHWIQPMPFADVFAYMRKSKIVLNVMPWFKAGSHERVFNTLLSGACPVSDKSSWLEEHFADRKEIAYYDLKEMERLPQLIEELLHDNALRGEIVLKGQEKAARQFCVEKVIGEALKRVIDIYYP